MLTVREDLVLARQEGAAGVDEVDAGKVVLQRNFLRAQVLLHRHRVVGAALDRRVVGNDDALATRHTTDTGDDAGARALVVVQAVGRQWGQLEERAALVEQRVDAISRQQLPSAHVALARALVATQRCLRQFLLQFVHQNGVIGPVARSLRDSTGSHPAAFAMS